MNKKELTYKIIGCCMAVHSELGGGLLEHCYHNALYFELVRSGLAAGYNVPFNVYYKGNQVGEYYADLVVNKQVIIELKSVKLLTEVHMAQLINYMHIAKINTGLLVNFQGSSLEWRRVII